MKPTPPWPYRYVERVVFVALVAMAVVVLGALCGCATNPPRWDAYSVRYTPPVLINGFDPTLTSHQEALGIKP